MSSFITVYMKELRDHFTSWRFIFILLVVLLASLYAVFVAASNIRQAVTGSTDFVFLALFTTTLSSTASSLIPNSFLSLMAVIIPIVGITLGFDAINSERNEGTLSRLISQPIYRDNIINAKFLAGVVTIAILLFSIVLLVSGLGMRLIGIPPSSEEVWRLIFFLIIGIVYGAFWLGLSILFSTLFRQVAISAIVSIAIWLFFAFFYPIIFSAIAQNLSGASDTQASLLRNYQTLITLQRISPIQLFTESTIVILAPAMRSVSQMLQLYVSDIGNYLLPTPISLGQSLLSVWPLLIVTILLTIICFAMSYLKFMFEEIRAT
jgi:ABC-2 type transport system permease protein